MDAGQQERKLRGRAFEDLVIEELEKRGCRIEKRLYGGGPIGEERPDLYALCDGKRVRVEAKLASAYHKDSSRASGVREGRFILSPGISFKECYAFGIDDPRDDTLTMDFVKAEIPDDFIRTHARFPKYPISKLKEIRDSNRCFVDIGTITRPRTDLLEKLREVR